MAFIKQKSNEDGLTCWDATLQHILADWQPQEDESDKKYEREVTDTREAYTAYTIDVPLETESNTNAAIAADADSDISSTVQNPIVSAANCLPAKQTNPQTNHQEQEQEAPRISLTLLLDTVNRKTKLHQRLKIQPEQNGIRFSPENAPNLNAPLDWQSASASASASASGRDRDRDRDRDRVYVNTSPYAHYEHDPVGFCRSVLRQEYAPDIIRVMESVSRNTVTLVRSSTGYGKSHCAASIATWYFLTRDKCQVYTTSAPPEDNLKRILWGEIGAIIEHHSILFAGCKASTLHIERTALDFIEGVAIPLSGTVSQRESKFSGKHRPYLLFIVDEGDAVPIEIYRAIEGCMSGGVEVRLLVLFNPRAEIGPVYQMERTNSANVIELNAFNHPNVLTGANVFPGAVTRETVARRINQWTEALPPAAPATAAPAAAPAAESSDVFDVPPHLVGCIATSLKGEPYPPLPAGLRRITEPSFFYMVLGRYPTISENQLISRTWIAAAVNRFNIFCESNMIDPNDPFVWTHSGVQHIVYPTAHVADFPDNWPPHIPPPGTPIMGLDVAELGPDQNVAAFRYPNGLVAPLLSWGGVDPLVTGETATMLFKRHHARFGVVDANGVGASVAPYMQRLDCNAYGVKMQQGATTTAEENIGEFDRIRDQLWWMCRNWLRDDPHAMIPDDEKLIEELAAPRYGFRAGRIKVTDSDTLREQLRRSVDRATALVLTFCPQPESLGPLNEFSYFNNEDDDADRPKTREERRRERHRQAASASGGNGNGGGIDGSNELVTW